MQGLVIRQLLEQKCFELKEQENELSYIQKLNNVRALGYRNL